MRKSGVKIRTKKYDRFRGVDFTTDPALVDDSRSPWAPNLVADSGGMPEKRPGWRVLKTFTDERINGIYSAKFSGSDILLVHAGQKVYRYYGGDSAVAHITPVPDAKSCGVYMGGKVWIFTGGGLYVYYGTDQGGNMVPASFFAYVPLTIIARSPSGGGERYEDINMITPKQKIGVLADGTSTVYKLPYDTVDSVDEVEANGVVLTAGTDYTVSTSEGKVTFATAPAAPAAGAEDNVFITFSKTIAGYADRIGKCRFGVAWGVGGAADRLVASGNPDYPNQDFISGYGDGAYWPDLSYSIIGTSDTAIVGYRRLGAELAIIKEPSDHESTVYIRSGSLSDSGEAVFSVKPCISGAGAVSHFGFGNIDDDQLFLTNEGVYALTTNSLTSEKIVQNRSYRVDPALAKENLSEAVCCNFNSKFLVFVGGHVYGLDGKQPKSYPSRYDTSFLYECFYWNNVPARCVARIQRSGEEALYFGDEDGRLCRFNTDMPGLDKYNDNGEPIEAIWSTRMDDDGDPMVLKTMTKKGNAVTIKPYARSSAAICIRTDKNIGTSQDDYDIYDTMDIFTWEDIDFSRFTFNSNDAPQEIVLGRKVKNYKRIQFLIRNNVLNEGFGVYCITKHYVTGNFAKY